MLPSLDPALFELTLQEAAEKYQLIAAASKMPREDLEAAAISLMYQLKVQKKMVKHLLKYINEQTYKSISTSQPSQ